MWHSENQSVDVASQVVVRRQRSCGIAGERNERHERPVDQHQQRGHGPLSPWARVTDEKRRPDVRKTQALKHARHANRREVRRCDDRVQHQSERDERQPSPEHAREKAGIGHSSSTPLERKGHRASHDEDEEWEHDVGGGTAVPVGVKELGKDSVPVTGVVDQNHRGDRRAAKHVERLDVVSGRLHRRRGRRRYCEAGSSVATFSPSHQHSGIEAGSPSRNSSLLRPNASMNRPMTSIWLE